MHSGRVWAVVMIGSAIAAASGCAHSKKQEIGSEERRSARVADSRDSTSQVVLAADETIPPGEISLEELRSHAQNETAIIVDARGAELFRHGHVRGAINVPPSEMETHIKKQLGNVDRDRLIIIYCTSATCPSSDIVSEFLREKGFTNTRVYRQGWLTLAHAKDLR